MPIIETEVEVFCGACGAGLCNQSRLSRTRSMPQITVEPCQNCLDQEREEGRQQGIEESKERIGELEDYVAELQASLRHKQ